MILVDEANCGLVKLLQEVSVEDLRVLLGQLVPNLSQLENVPDKGLSVPIRVNQQVAFEVFLCQIQKFLAVYLVPSEDSIIALKFNCLQPALYFFHAPLIHYHGFSKNSYHLYVVELASEPS